MTKIIHPRHTELPTKEPLSQDQSTFKPLPIPLMSDEELDEFVQAMSPKKDWREGVMFSIGLTLGLATSPLTQQLLDKEQITTWQKSLKNSQTPEFLIETIGEENCEFVKKGVRAFFEGLKMIVDPLKINGVPITETLPKTIVGASLDAMQTGIDGFRTGYRTVFKKSE